MGKPTGFMEFPRKSVPYRDARERTNDFREIFTQAAALGPVFARHRYVFLFLFRRGVGLSAGQGSHAGDLLQTELATGGQEARNRLQLRLLENDELSDARAGLDFLRSLATVDSRRIAIAGHSFGGSLTPLLLERDSTIRGAILFGSAAGSWESSPELRARLLSAVDRLAVPVFFIHAANDYSTAPGKALAAEMTRLKKPRYLRIYPAFGASPSDGHNLVDLGVAIWEHDAFNFLDNHVRR